MLLRQLAWRESGSVRRHVIDRFLPAGTFRIVSEFVSRSAATGFDDFNKLRSILASRVKIDDNTYKSIYMDESV